MATLDYALLDFKISFLHVTLRSASPRIVNGAAKYFSFDKQARNFATLLPTFNYLPSSMTSNSRTTLATLESKRSMYINTYVYIKSAICLNTNIYEAARIRITMEKRTSIYARKTVYEAQGDSVKCAD